MTDRTTLSPADRFTLLGRALDKMRHERLSPNSPKGEQVIEDCIVLATTNHPDGRVVQRIGGYAPDPRDHAAEVTRKVVAIGPYCWGAGRTGADAIRNAKREFPRGLVRGWCRIAVYDAPAEASVTELGGIACPRGESVRFVGSIAYSGGSR